MCNKSNQIFIQAICLLFLVIGDCHAMSKEQLKKSGRMMKKSCMAKSDVTEGEVGDIDKGKFIEEKKVMCYIACIYSLGQVIQNNKLSINAMMMQIDSMFPNEVKDDLKAALTSCKDLVKKYKDVCESSYYVTKCMYDAAPNSFLFP